MVIVPGRLVRGSRRFPAAPLFVLSGVTQYVGAAIAVLLFAVAPAIAVGWARIAVAAVLLVLWRRPWRRRWTRAQLRATTAFGVVLAGMNLAFYVAIDHLPLGNAVAIEFIGPVAVAAITGSGWRERVAIGLAAGGVVLLAGVTLGGADGGGSVIGLVAALAAGAFWAGYILLGRRVATGASGVTGLSVAMVVGGVVFAPFFVVPAAPLVQSWRLAGLLVVVAVCSSVIPYALEQVALHLLRPATFAVLLALLPTTAAAVGSVLLGQLPAPAELLGLLLVSGAIALTALRRTPAPPEVASTPAS